MTISLVDHALSFYMKIRRRSGNSSSMKRLIFLHIPKCGGTSIDQALQKKYIRAGYRITHINSHASKRGAEIACENLRDFRSRLLLYEMALNRTQYISGHISYSEQAWKNFSDEWHFMTVLREPVARWYSHYFFNRYKTDDHFRINEPLEVFVESKLAQYLGRNYVQVLTANGEAYTDKAVEQAIANLQRFPLVGVLEEIDTLLRDCERFLSVSIKPKLVNQNPRTKQQQKDEITPEIAERVNALCEPNRCVYEAIRLRIIQQGSWLDH